MPLMRIEDFYPQAALREAGTEVALEILPGCDHLGTGVPTGDPNSPWMAKAHAFLARH